MPVILTATGGTGMTQLLSDIGTTLTSVIGWFGDMVTALVTTNGELNGLFPCWLLELLFPCASPVLRSFAPSPGARKDWNPARGLVPPAGSFFEVYYGCIIIFWFAWMW